MKESINIKEVFAINEGKGNATRWTRVGIGFVNRDGSINVVLDAVPLNGRLQIRDRKPKSEE